MKPAWSLLFAAATACGAGAQVAVTPATQPAASQPAAPPSVLVTSLASPANGQYPWVGRQIARDLATDLGNATRAKVELGSAVVPDPQSARQAAMAHGESIAIYGSAQAAGNQVRVTGQVIDANTGATLGTLNATASADNLFPLEGQLFHQVVSALPRLSQNTTTAVAQGPAPGPQYASVTVPPYQSPTYPQGGAEYGPDYYDAAPYDYYGYYDAYPYIYPYRVYSYPSWWWYEPYYWYGPTFYYGHRLHDWDHDHGWGHHFGGRPWRYGGPGHGHLGFGGARPGHIGMGHLGVGEGHFGGGHVGGGHRGGFGGGHAGR